MRSLRVVHAVAIASLVMVTAGCSSGGESASKPENTQVTVSESADPVGASFDVRRDPG